MTATTSSTFASAAIPAPRGRGWYACTDSAGVEAVVAGIPFADVLGLMAHHRAPQEYTQTLHSAAAKNAFRVVSPLAMPPEAAASPRAMSIGRGDRLIPADQSAALADAWFGSPVHRYRGGHTGYLWSRATKAFATGFLRDAL